MISTPYISILTNRYNLILPYARWLPNTLHIEYNPPQFRIAPHTGTTFLLLTINI